MVGKAREERRSRAVGVSCVDRAGEGVEILTGAVDERQAACWAMSWMDRSDSSPCGQLLEFIEAGEPAFEVVLL